MTNVTNDQGQDGVELSAADEQLLRELTERARASGLKPIRQSGATPGWLSRGAADVPLCVLRHTPSVTGPTDYRR